jgi:hypothetical protein
VALEECLQLLGGRHPGELARPARIRLGEHVNRPPDTGDDRHGGEPVGLSLLSPIGRYRQERVPLLVSKQPYVPAEGGFAASKGMLLN